MTLIWIPWSIYLASPHSQGTQYFCFLKINVWNQLKFITYWLACMNNLASMSKMYTNGVEYLQWANEQKSGRQESCNDWSNHTWWPVDHSQYLQFGFWCFSKHASMENCARMSKMYANGIVGLVFTVGLAIMHNGKTSWRQEQMSFHT